MLHLVSKLCENKAVGRASITSKILRLRHILPIPPPQHNGAILSLTTKELTPHDIVSSDI